MRKELRDTIISGVGGILVLGIIKYLTPRKYPFDPWAYLITYSIFGIMAYLIGGLRKRREEKKEEEAVQRRE